MSLFKKIFGSVDNIKSPEVQSKYNDLSAVDPETKIERFITLFIKNGGKFLYCESLIELREQFINILEENDWFECEVLCNEQNLYPILDENKLQYNKSTSPIFLFSTCESLITEDGSILFSSNQIKQLKPNELPKNIIVFATTRQIVETKSDGLRTIKNKYNSDYPTNITTIRYFEETKTDDFLHYGSMAKNIYLLLLEDL
jgi:L-lactate utilization protein LutC